MTSSTPARVKRTIVAAAGSARVSAGRAMCEQRAAQGFHVPVEQRIDDHRSPVIGRRAKAVDAAVERRQPSFIAKRNCSRIASQNAAMASPETVTTRRMWSSSELRYSAESTPSGMPSATDSVIAARVSSRVAGRRVHRSSAIGRWL